MDGQIKVELPDIDDMFDIIKEIHDLSLRKSLLNLEINKKEAEVTTIATSDERYFINNKPPSQAYINSTLVFTGINNELLPLRKEEAELSVRIGTLRSRLDLMKTLIDIWRTQEANERLATM